MSIDGVVAYYPAVQNPQKIKWQATVTLLQTLILLNSFCTVPLRSPEATASILVEARTAQAGSGANRLGWTRRAVPSTQSTAFHTTASVSTFLCTAQLRLAADVEGNGFLDILIFLVAMHRWGPRTYISPRPQRTMASPFAPNSNITTYPLP